MLQIGDWVRFKTWNEMVKEFGVITGTIHCRFGFTKGMKPLCGLIAQVLDVEGNLVSLGENPVVERAAYDFSFSEDMVKKIRRPQW